MLSYNLTKIKLTDLKNLYFFIKNIFKFHSQQKSKQFPLQLLGKLIAAVIIDTKS